MLASRIIVVPLLLYVIATVWTQAAESGEVTLQQIHAAWRNRQDRVKSAHFKWIDLRTIPRGHYGQKGADFYPPEDTSHEFESELFISGDMIRYEWKGIDWIQEKEQFVERSYLSASGLSASRTLYSNHVDNRSTNLYPLGFIRHQRFHEDIGNPHVEIPIFAVRALARGIGCAGELERTITATQPAVVSIKSLNGSPHAHIQQQFGQHSREVWADPAKDFSITQYVLHLHGRRIYQIKATYKPDHTIGWVPATWRIDRWIPTGSASDLPRSGVGGTSTVTMYEINSNISAGTFRPEFPAGTRVVDNRSGFNEYLVKEGGAARPILEQEIDRNVTYEELMESEVGKAGLYRSESSSMLLWALAGVVVLAIVLFLCWRRWESPCS